MSGAFFSSLKRSLVVQESILATVNTQAVVTRALAVFVCVGSKELSECGFLSSMKFLPVRIPTETCSMDQSILRNQRINSSEVRTLYGSFTLVDFLFWRRKVIIYGIIRRRVAVWSDPVKCSDSGIYARGVRALFRSDGRPWSHVDQLSTPIPTLDTLTPGLFDRH